MRKLLVSGVLASAGLVVSCGSSGIGGDGAGSFYNLNVVLDNSAINSKTVSLNQGLGLGGVGMMPGTDPGQNLPGQNPGLNLPGQDPGQNLPGQNPGLNLPGQMGIPMIFLPDDTISGKISLVYTGNSSNPLRGVVKEASLCVLDNCFNVPIMGVVVPNGQPVSFSLKISSHKVALPWIAINPFEDKIIQSEMVQDRLSGGMSVQEVASVYVNSLKTEYLSRLPVAKNSVKVSYEGVFSNEMTVRNYSSPSVINLEKGIATSNSILPNSVVVIVGNSRYKDDGNGKIVDNQNNEVGSINYQTGSLVMNNISERDITVSYKVSGSLLCLDDGRGSLGQDCSNDSAINYSSGQLSYKFKYTINNVPATVNITYGQGSSSSNYIVYNLPPRSTAGMYMYNVYGRVVEVYQGNMKLCDNTHSNTSCSITRNGDAVKITFNSSVPSDLTIKYSKDLKVDINPAIDATLYNGSYKGTTNPTVVGTLRVKVKLEDGSTLTADTPITFNIVP